MLWKNSNWQIICFFICVLLFYPLVWVRLFSGHLPYWGELYIFTPGTLALAAVILLLSTPERLPDFFSSGSKIAVTVFAVFLLAAGIQLFKIYPDNSNYIWTSFYWITIPLFCAVNRFKIEKLLPYFMAFLAIVTLIQSCSYIFAGSQCYGLPGNWNWNASLIAVSFPFVSLVIYLHCGKNTVWQWSNAVLAFIGLALIFSCRSKAAVAALLAASFFILILRYRRKLPLIFWLRSSLIILAVIIVLGVIFKARVYEILKEDQRIALWSGVIDLIHKYPWFGCGPELFESAIAPSIPEDYYFCKFVSIRHLHAHNQFLHLAATMGIPALLSWCTLMIFILVKCLPQAIGAGNRKFKLYLFVFMFLLVYSFLDVVPFSWPLGCIFLMFTGILLGHAVESPPRKNARFQFGKPLTVCSHVFECCLVLLLLYQIYLNFFNSLYYRNARLMIDRKENVEKIFDEVEKSIAVKPTPRNTMLAAMISLYDFKCPQDCLKYLNMLGSTGFENYEHNNLLAAKALTACGRPLAALKYFDREFENYPLSCVNLYYYQLVLRKTGRTREAEAVNRHLDKILEMKGFDRSMLPSLLKNPYMDLHFRYNDHKAD
ncbi:MAG: O-antigen ligase family protein [Victivallales bacterium]|nr:O-antigen ligase family protein [Victivallales bacterium]